MASRPKSLRSRVPILGAVLGLMLVLGVLGASTASAAEWEIEGSSLYSRGLVQESVGGSGSMTIAAKLLGQSFSVSCGAETSGNIQRRGTSETTLSLSGCVVTAPTYENAACTVASTTSHVLKSEQITVGGTPYERITPASGTVFLTLSVKNCPIAGSYNLTGTLAAQANPEGTLYYSQPLIFSPAINEAVGAIVKLGTNPASVTGEVSRSMAGGNSGMRWGRGGFNGESEEEVLPSEWLINTQTLKSRSLASESIGFSGGPFTFETVLMGQKIVFSCTELTSAEASISQGATGSTAWKFKGCTVSTPANCTVEDISTTLLKSSFLLVGGKVYEKFAPTGGEVLFTLKFPSCGSLSGSYNVKGAFAGRTERYGLERTQQKLAFSPTISSEAKTFMNLSTNPFSMTGEMSQALTGANAGQVWSAR